VLKIQSGEILPGRLESVGRQDQTGWISAGCGASEGKKNPSVFSRSKMGGKIETKFVSSVSGIWNRVVLKTKSSRS
jgi:hypothetical protein